MPDYTRWLNASTASRDEEMFAGLYAALLEISERTVERHWKLTKLWLYRAMKE